MRALPYVTCEDGIQLFYLDRGSGQPVLFVHGFGTSHMVWEASVAATVDRCRPISIDMRGHGRSERPMGPYTIEQYARDINALLRHLDIRDVAYVGWSMAGQVGLTYMRLFGDRVSRLLLVDPVMPPYTEHGLSPEMAQQFVAMMRSTKDRPHFFLELARNNFFHAPVPEATKQWFWMLVMDASPLCDELLLDIVRLDEREHFSDIHVPVTIVHGKYDKQCPIEVGQYLVEHLPTARLLEFENSGHVPFVDEQARWEEVLQDFIDTGLK